MKNLFLLMIGLSILVGCQKSDPKVLSGTATNPNKPPVFTLSFSEYPSWSTFGVAAENGLVDPAEGKQSALEKKWGVDLVITLKDYEACINLYSSGQIDASCLTNLDSLAPATGRPTVVILPTSTSDGADAVIVPKDADLAYLKKNATYGLEKSVSQYVFERNLVLQNETPKDYTFKNMDPAAAAQALQTKQPNINSIIVWNPFVLQTLRTRDDVKVLFDSTTIPEEIIDCVVVSKESLKRPGGEAFACAVIDVFYEVNKLLENSATRNDTLVALGSKFSSLNASDMEICCKQTRFYSTPDKALKLFNDSKFQKQTSPTVVEFAETHEIVEKVAGKRIGFNDDSVPLNFTTKYIELYQSKQ